MNEDINTYLNRKQLEIDLLSKYTKKNLIDKINIDNVYDIKNKIKSKVLSTVIKQNRQMTPTNYENKTFFSYSTTYDYTYQRYDSRIKHSTFNSNVYGINQELNIKTFFTNSGMSSIFTILFVLSNNGYFIEYNRDIYFETIKVIKKVFRKRNVVFNFLNSKKVIFLDSISSKKDFYNQIKKTNAKIIVFDTTCFFHVHINQII